MIISDVIVCDSRGEKNVDVRVEDGLITEVGANLSGDEKIEGKGAYLMPGLIDTNVRLKDAQLNSKRITQLSQVALRGGVTRAILSPESTPSIDNEIVLEFLENQHNNGSKISPMIATTVDDEVLSNIAILLKRGAAAPYMSTVISNNLACRIAEYVKMYDVTLFCRCKDKSLSEIGVMNEGNVATKLGLVGITPLGEMVHVARMIEISRHFGIKILFKAVSNPQSIALITKAKSEGVAVSCEVSIHHLCVSDKACDDFNTTAKIDPPLMAKEDVIALQEALKNGEIDLLTALHQPNSPVNKEVAFFDASFGCDAIEDALSLYYTKLVKSGMITLSEMLRLCVNNPAKSIRKTERMIEVGHKADLVIFDSKADYKVENSQSLYHGETLYGKVITAFIDGNPIHL